jgi:hypothetical protein
MKRSEIKLGEEYAFCPGTGRWNGVARVKVIDLGPFLRSRHVTRAFLLEINGRGIVSPTHLRGNGGQYVAVYRWLPATAGTGPAWSPAVSFVNVAKIRMTWKEAETTLAESTKSERQARTERDAAREYEYREREELTQLAAQAGIEITVPWHTDGLVPLTRDQFRVLLAEMRRGGDDA